MNLDKMKIFIDIGHPAHVHYFRNFVKIMEGKGHKILITARDKEVTHQLLKFYNIPFISRGRGGTKFIGKFLYLIKGNFILFKSAFKFKPDLFLSFGSPYAAQVSKLFRKQHIAIDDTEHAKLEHMMYVPFTDVIITPASFKKRLSKKQIYINSFTELLYLHTNYFKPDKKILDKIGILQDEMYVIVRFVSWEASHDFNAKGLSLINKIKLIKEISRFAKVFITSEKELPIELKEYKLNIKPDEMHDVLAYSSLFIGESGTMSSECAMLGVPNIQIRHTLDPDKLPGVHLELQSRGLKFLKKSNDINGIIAKSIEVLGKHQTMKESFQNNRLELLKSNIDFTAYLCKFVENFSKREAGLLDA